MTKISPEVSAKISLFSFAGTVCVCLLHVPWPVDSEATRLLGRAILAVCPAALAFFFAFAGYFLARHAQEPGWWRQAVAKRVFTLGGPYCIWLLAFLAFFTTVVRPEFSFFHYNGIASVLGLVPWNPPRLVPYWFMRCLFLFVLVSPFVVKAVAAGWGLLLIAMLYALNLVYWLFVALGVIGMETPYVGSFFWYGFNLDGFVYFVLGIYLAMRPLPRLSARAVRVCGLVAATLVFLYLVCVRFSWCRDVFPSAVIAPFLTVFLWHVAPSWNLPSLFRGVMFPVYLLHIIVLETYCHFRGWSGRGLCECLFILALEVFLPIFVSKAIHFASPRLAAILFGGR